MTDQQKGFVILMALIAYVLTTMRFLFYALVTGSETDAYTGYGMIAVLLVGIFVLLGKSK